MRPQDLEQLLYEEEGTALDFKRDQYPFAKVSEEDKSELLKDILGFANCWRRADAFILIGVEDVQGGRGIVHGITEHLQDHSLQQFVNNLTNRPIQFGYEASEIDGKQIGIIRIELQRRPIYLKRDYGKLKKGAVYVRRGSSTDPSKPADPDEISHMGSELAVGTKEASLFVEFAALDREQNLGETIEWSAEYCKVPSQAQIPELEERRPDPIRLPSGRTLHLPDLRLNSPYSRLNPRYYQLLAEFISVHRLARKIRLVITNSGNAPALAVRLEIKVPHDQELEITCSSEMPSAPKKQGEWPSGPILKHLVGRPALRRNGSVHIEKSPYETNLEIDCGDLQPGRKIWSDEFHLLIFQSGSVQINGTLFASNLPRPKAFALSINAHISHTEMSVHELMRVPEPEDHDK